MMRKTNEGQSPVGILLPSVLAGLLGTLLLMLLGAVLVHRGTLAEGAIAPCALVFLALGQCACRTGRCKARRRKPVLLVARRRFCRFF